MNRHKWFIIYWHNFIFLSLSFIALFNTKIITHWSTLPSDPFVFCYVDTLYWLLAKRFKKTSLTETFIDVFFLSMYELSWADRRTETLLHFPHSLRGSQIGWRYRYRQFISLPPMGIQLGWPKYYKMQRNAKCIYYCS